MSNPKKPDASKMGSTGKDAAAAAAADAKPASQATVSIASAAGAEAPEDPAAIAAAKGAGSAKKGMPAAAAVPAQKSVGTLELSDLFAAAARVSSVEEGFDLHVGWWMWVVHVIVLCVYREHAGGGGWQPKKQVALCTDTTSRTQQLPMLVLPIHVSS
jgi:hypothetical protein